MKLKITNICQLATYNSQTSAVEKTTDPEIVIEGGQIVEIGENLPSAEDTIDAGHRLVTPGFVDPHSHPVFAETREKEFEMRVAGKSYQAIAAAGGGIKSSVKALREADEDTLVDRVAERMRRFLSLGTTTVEAKSGYGLSTESELKSLRVLDRVSGLVPIDIVPTFLGAHDFPEEYVDRRAAYVDLLRGEMIPAVAEEGLAEFCDVFCEDGWFSVDDSRHILQTAERHGMKIRMHADEFRDSGAASLAAELNADSADHLMHVSDESISRLAEAGVVATLLPGTTFFLGKTNYAPARKLLESGVEVALGTDFNPGSSMIQSMPLIMTLACLYLEMSVEEAFAAATHFAAKSLDRDQAVGSIEVGRQADLVIWDLKHLSQIPYSAGGNYVEKVIKRGRIVYESAGK